MSGRCDCRISDIPLRADRQAGRDSRFADIRPRHEPFAHRQAERRRQIQLPSVRSDNQRLSERTLRAGRMGAGVSRQLAISESRRDIQAQEVACRHSGRGGGIRIAVPRRRIRRIGDIVAKRLFRQRNSPSDAERILSAQVGRRRDMSDARPDRRQARYGIAVGVAVCLRPPYSARHIRRRNRTAENRQTHRHNLARADAGEDVGSGQTVGIRRGDNRNRKTIKTTKYERQGTGRNNRGVLDIRRLARQIRLSDKPQRLAPADRPVAPDGEISYRGMPVESVDRRTAGRRQGVLHRRQRRHNSQGNHRTARARHERAHAAGYNRCRPLFHRGNRIEGESVADPRKRTVGGDKADASVRTGVFKQNAISHDTGRYT